jgi:hypothetical protein
MITKLTISISVWLDKIFIFPLLTYRKFRYGYPYRRIYLGEGYWTILDLEDYYRLRKYKWIVGGKDGKFYAMRGVKVSEREIKLICMHREIMSAPPRWSFKSKSKEFFDSNRLKKTQTESGSTLRSELLVDHRNRNSLDNRRANLRWATASQNSYNREKTSSKSSSKYRGVTFNKRRNKWYARIKVNRKTIFLGSYTDEQNAAKAYDLAALMYYHEFAHLNFPE